MGRFGRGMLEHWLLDPDVTYLNHGTVGATPTRVLDVQQRLRDEIERRPSQFMLRELAGSHPAPWRRESRLREAARQVAAFVHAAPEDLVFVPNVTTGLNGVLRSLPLAPGDEILMTDLAYGAITLAAGYAARERGASVRVLELPFPIRTSDQVVEAIASGLQPQTRLLVIDHVTAQSALVLPVAAIAEVCHARGVQVLVDGAHAPGSIALDVPSLGADWYAANLHKWAHAPRACGFLWARADRQAGLHPPVISWGFDKGFREEYEWGGTTDPTSYLAAPEGLSLLREWGWDDVLAYMHDLAWKGGELLTKRWHTTIEADRSMIGAMITVPLPAAAGSTDADASALRLALLTDDHLEVQLHAWRGRLWTRVSAQIYNDLSDIERLADAVCRRI